ncbi:MAG: ATP-dependent zinc metalloprotease FtsH [Alphaproteobacteria bacterium]|nr:ATP-dependent zinc metalloprotease FtsH [Alphaproteobacteria bacterium]MBU0806066.1 ATP-dependent zinc metalloprotease FtsH [Alphaproteobacteria bacterium]MBU0873966.1 ATP-dependent zinc metalloprotease FtsH [Alphaproteobacteria bacterium]MBU1402211.1 ATP-dependent zinc metalloprotease FtsH [Alphaproteobacteria bacterium]MBU1590856.1 ATP-dependent zinc metalloprotease FtsH [Alphaproteobacteria bacterium]
MPDGSPTSKSIPYSEIKQLIGTGEVSAVTLEATAIVAVLREPTADGIKTVRAITPQQPDPALLPMLEENSVLVVAEEPRAPSVLISFLPWLLIIAFYFWLSRRMTGGGFSGGLPGGLGDLLGRSAKPTKPASKITFADVAGQDEAKREVSELVEFLRDPKRFEKVGASVPHGVLLMGPPGTGKTLLARALAGEAEVPFFSTSGSEFIEVFVGVGAGRVRKMFEAARKQAPAIIFIDELDSIGRTRGTGVGGGHDEREQTLNQILAELDGFTAREAVVVLAATNRPDVLDPALLRPGRFDRHVTLSLPDKGARRAILDVHAKNLPLRSDVALDLVAAGTPGFSGADLKNLLNEAAITAARRSGSDITPADLDEARDKVMMGTVRTLAIQPDEKHRLAVHEAGHTAAAYYNPDADPLYKVTIIPRGRSLGGTHMLPENERHTLSEAYLQVQLTTLLAGRAAEKTLLGSVSSGADDDIRRATIMARSMVARWGMDPEIGPIDLWQSEDHPFLGQQIAQPRSFADETAARVDQAVMNLLHEAEEQAISLIESHRDQIARLVARLEAEETLNLDAIRECLADDTKITPFVKSRK